MQKCINCQNFRERDLHCMVSHPVKLLPEKYGFIPTCIHDSDVTMLTSDAIRVRLQDLFEWKQ